MTEPATDTATALRDRIADLEAQIADARRRQAQAEDTLAAERRIYADSPEDRLFHAKDSSWWRRKADGSLVRAEPPAGLCAPRHAPHTEAPPHDRR